MASGTSWERLKAFVQCIAIRRTKATIEQEINLPQRKDIVQAVNLDGEERKIYDLIKRNFALSIDSGGTTLNAFTLILRLRQVCNHGRDLLPAHLQRWTDQARLFSDEPLPNSASCELCNNIPVLRGSSLVVLPCLHQLCQTCTIKWDDKGDKDQNTVCPLCEEPFPGAIEKSFGGLDSDSPWQYKPSSKVRALITNLNVDRKEAAQSRAITAKRQVLVLCSTFSVNMANSTYFSVVFSSWSSMLDLISSGLAQSGISCQRLDGSMSLPQRRRALDVFRCSSDCQVLLATLGAAGVGYAIPIN